MWARDVNSEVKPRKCFVSPSVQIYTPKNVLDSVPKSVLEECEVARENSSRQRDHESSDGRGLAVPLHTRFYFQLLQRILAERESFVYIKESHKHHCGI